jgi:hypothetical protein
VTLTETSRTETQPSTSRRWPWIGAVAAAITLLIGGVVLLARDDTPDSVVSQDGTEAAHGFIAAFNDRDLTAMEAVSTDGLTIDSALTVSALSVEEFEPLLAWLEAFDWRWEDATCEIGSVGAEVYCEMFERNRLTDLTGAERPARVEFTMRNGAVETVDVNADLSDYSETAFNPFRAWVRNNHPDDAALMWTMNVPVLTTESAVLFDKYLTEYADNYPSASD